MFLKNLNLEVFINMFPVQNASPTMTQKNSTVEKLFYLSMTFAA